MHQFKGFDERKTCQTCLTVALNNLLFIFFNQIGTIISRSGNNKFSGNEYKVYLSIKSKYLTLGTDSGYSNFDFLMK